MFRSEIMTRLGAAVSSIVDLFAEMNYLTDRVRVFSANGIFAQEKKQKSAKSFLERIAQEFVLEEDREDFVKLCSEENIITGFCDGEGSIERDVRFCRDGGGEWYNVRFLPAGKDNGDFDGRVLLLLTNISERKGLERETEELKRQVERDPLTGLYNQRAAQTLIDDYLNGEGRNGRHTLMLCDLDEFKTVNDTLGHPIGDALLVDVAAKISATFRRDDIICRIGGDEFVILVKNTSGHSYVSRRAELLLERMKQPFPMGEQEIRITTSIGVVSYPVCGTTYAELFDCADKAMYLAKTNGKNQFRFFEESLTDGMRDPLLKPDEARESGVYRARVKLSDYIFSCMYESNDAEKTLPLVLQLMGTHFGLGRVFLAERADETLRVTGQWNTGSCEPVTRTVDYKGEARAEFEKARSCEDMLLRCDAAAEIPSPLREALEVSGVGGTNALILCALIDEGEIRGYLGFCDRCDNRAWTQEECDTFAYVSRLISLFIFKQRAHEHTVRALERSRRILDCSPAMMYIVDPETHRLLYVSGKVTEHVPEAKTGRLCHEVFLGSSEPCPFCPMAGWKRQGGGDAAYNCEVYSEHLDDWTESSATGITMEGGREACLCGCYSIRKHKLRERELMTECAELRERLERENKE